MTTMIIDCPHCHNIQTNLNVIDIKPIKLPKKTFTFSLVGFCSNCNSGVVINVNPSPDLQEQLKQNSDIQSIIQKHADTPINSLFDEVIKTFPTFPENKYITKIPITPTEISIDYENSKKIISRRRIRVNAIEFKIKKDHQIPIILDAYCFERKMPRNFTINKILIAYHPDTGEVIDDIAKYLTH